MGTEAFSRSFAQQRLATASRCIRARILVSEIAQHLGDNVATQLESLRVQESAAAAARVVALRKLAAAVESCDLEQAEAHLQAALSFSARVKALEKLLAPSDARQKSSLGLAA